MLRRPPLLPLVLTAVVLIGCGNHQGAVAADPTSSDHSASTRPHADGHGQGTTHTITDDSLGGDQSFVWTDTYYSVSNGEKLHDTGLVVYSAARVGRAVLLAYDYGEGNGTSASRAQAVARSTKAQRALVERMGEVAAG
jgi:hypothetical protein